MKTSHLLLNTCLLQLLLCTKVVSQNNCLHFNGSQDVEINNPIAFDFSTTDKFTIEAWFKTTSNTAVIFSNHVDLSPFPGYEVAIVYNKVVFQLIENYMSSSLRVETVNSFNDGNWHHVACVYGGVPSSSNTRIYVDGVLQSITATSNNLSGPINSGNPPHIGSRDGTAYFFNGMIDELRVWKRALCASEIVARMNCHLVRNEFQLFAYYDFNQANAGGNNTGFTLLIDRGPLNFNGNLNNFALTGPTSNWVSSTANITGTCGPGIPLTIAGPTIACPGTVTQLTVSGGSSYTWQPVGVFSSVMAVSPTVMTTYTLTAETPAACFGTTVITLPVSPPVNINATTSATLLCKGQSATLTASGASSYTWSGAGGGALSVVSPTSNTAYTVTAENLVGCKTSTIIQLAVSASCPGLREEMNPLNLQLYPNPTSGLIKIESMRGEVQTRFTDITGRPVLEKLLFTGLNEMDISGFPAGLYFATFYSGESTLTIKIIKE